MPKREDLRTILLIGSGPIVIGQGCEFDYSGTQACRALKCEGYRVVLLNSNPATIMTDPDLADRTYIEPITPEVVERILVSEARLGNPISALLPTVGGQTGLNCAMAAAEQGILDRHNVELIGATCDVINRAEDRALFRETMIAAGLPIPRSGIARTMDEARARLAEIGLPCCIRPAYTLGGEGGGFAGTVEEFEQIAARGIKASRIDEILIEESLLHWKEFELEVVRDQRDNVIVVCSIENFDPMGVHTGDSITVAPAQTLTDRQYQAMRETAKAVVRAVGVTCGGCNVQFAVCPRTGRQYVIEINPRVSRSSALASKATGYPIAKVAAKLAVGYSLDEIPNDITGTTPASFEPALDYCVVKMPRWAFEKFPDADETLTTVMKSVGEGMAMGRNFKEAWQKCIRSMEVQRAGYGLDENDKWLEQLTAAEFSSSASAFVTGGAMSASTWAPAGARNTRSAAVHAKGTTVARAAPASSVMTSAWGPTKRADGAAAVVAGSQLGEAPPDLEESHVERWPVPDRILRDKLRRPCQGRPYYIRYAFKLGYSITDVHDLTGIDPWFLQQLKDLVDFEDTLVGARSGGAGAAATMAQARQWGYSGAQLARLQLDPCGETEASFRLVDTCAAELEARTPYYYATHEAPYYRLDSDGLTPISDDELRVDDRPHVIIIGGGPNRIGQGIEFDYCCVHAVQAAREMGYAAVMVNSNPETVSTDYDISDVLFFEPLTLEDVLRIHRGIASQTRVAGVVIQFGGQTPINLGAALEKAGCPILGTPPACVHLAEERAAFQAILDELGLRQPPNGMARDCKEAVAVADRIGYPVLIRPSYVLGGRAMRLCNNREDVEAHIAEAFDAARLADVPAGAQQVLIDKFVLDATEVDVDAVADFRRPDDDAGDCVVAGIMEHIEEAGIHSGDSSCALPPHSLSKPLQDTIARHTVALARRLGVCGLMNVQFAVTGDDIYVLEVNPRASRTVPFVSKATGVPWAKIAMQVMLGRRLRDVLWDAGVGRQPKPIMRAIKMPVFPFEKFRGVDLELGPEMRSTGEVMGIDTSFGLAYAKAAIATGLTLPLRGNALVSVNDPDKPRIVPIARDLRALGFKLFSTQGTHAALRAAGIESILVSKHADAPDSFLLNLINSGVLDLLINTPIHQGRAWEEGRWRAATVARRIPLITTLAGARAAVEAIRVMQQMGPEFLQVRALQDYVT